jgi:hypothetical protein
MGDEAGCFSDERMLKKKNTRTSGGTDIDARGVDPSVDVYANMITGKIRAQILIC